MHVLVLGGNGFIGSHVVAVLMDSGHRVSVIDRAPAPSFAHSHSIEHVGRDIDHAVATLPSIDIVCHLAYSSIPSTSNADPVADVIDNLAGSVRLLEAMRAAGKQRIVYLSSGGAVYGSPRSVPISEDHPLDPISSYGVTKVAFEKYLGMYAALYGFKPTIIRPSNPFGPGQGKMGLLGVVNTFLHAALVGAPVTIWGDGTSVRDYVYVGDLASLVKMVVEGNATGTYNCGRGVGVTLLELADLVEELTGRPLERAFRPVRGFDPPLVVLDIKRATRELGWAPTTNLRVGLRLTQAWLTAEIEKSSQRT